MADRTSTETTVEPTTAALFPYLIRHGDDCLIMSHRLGEWISRAPELEEDIAMGNIGLDILGVGRNLLQYAGRVEGAGRTEDDLAFGRTEREFTNLLLVEQPNGDFGETMARQFTFDVYQHLLWSRLTASSDETIAGVAGKAVKESRYHVRHSRNWVVTLGDGTDESHRRMQAGLDGIWRFTHEMFIDDDIDRAAADTGIGILPSSLKADWDRIVTDTLADASLTIPEDTAERTGGRQGVHTEHMGFILAEMQSMYRTYPGAKW